MPASAATDRHGKVQFADGISTAIRCRERGDFIMTDATLDRLTHLIHDRYGVALDVIDPDAPFASYNLDSLTVAELMFEIDDAFHVSVPDEAATTVTTLRELAVLIDGLPTQIKKA